MSIAREPADASSAGRPQEEGTVHFSVEGVDLACAPASDFLWVRQTWAAVRELDSLSSSRALTVRLHAPRSAEANLLGRTTFERLLSREVLATVASRSLEPVSRLAVREVEPRGVDVVVPEGATTTERAELALAGLATAMGLENRCLLHGAAFSVAGMPVLAIADEGGGKSTLSASVLAMGGLLCDDDSLAVCRDDGGIRVAGLRQTVSLRFVPDAAGPFSRLRQLGTEDRDRFVIPACSAPQSWIPCLSPGSLWFLTGNYSDTSRVVRSMSFAEALARIVPATNSFLLASSTTGTWASLMPLIAGLVEQCKSYEVALGSDLLESPGRTLGGLLAQV